MSIELQSGSAAPAFDMPTDGGGRIRLADLKGKIVVLYFYPKDDTPGCTKEAIAFSEKIEAFKKLGATVVGVSKDSVAKHDRFKAKHGLEIVLAADEDGSVCDAYGVWVEKSMYGRTYMGIERSTFLIDGAGKIRKVWRKVKVAGHAEQVLDEIESL